MLIFILAVIFIVTGLLRQEQLTVLQKAANICLQCIGIG
ncbi:MAG: CD1871A family CXXC motif-containing protein [Lachnospiraceae bacterium]|nr:CD1871A family CXXC motif-containing protein [Lachnospiraceae bacterium]MDD4524627.1 CD1871A family CXXC motif-containing protein [Lachnospiraceae bacterium]